MNTNQSRQHAFLKHGTLQASTSIAHVKSAGPVLTCLRRKGISPEVWPADNIITFMFDVHSGSGEVEPMASDN